MQLPIGGSSLSYEATSSLYLDVNAKQLLSGCKPSFREPDRPKRECHLTAKFDASDRFSHLTRN